MECLLESKLRAGMSAGETSPGRLDLVSRTRRAQARVAERRQEIGHVAARHRSRSPSTSPAPRSAPDTPEHANQQANNSAERATENTFASSLFQGTIADRVARFMDTVNQCEALIVALVKPLTARAAVPKRIRPVRQVQLFVHCQLHRTASCTPSRNTHAPASSCTF